MTSGFEVPSQLPAQSQKSPAPSKQVSWIEGETFFIFFSHLWTPNASKCLKVSLRADANVRLEAGTLLEIWI